MGSKRKAIRPRISRGETVMIMDLTLVLYELAMKRMQCSRMKLLP